MLIKDLLIEAKSQLIDLVGDDPTGLALARRLHREAIVLYSSHAQSREVDKTLKYLSQLMSWPGQLEIGERFYVFKGSDGWAAAYVPRSEANNKHPTISIMVATEQGITVTPDALSTNAAFKRLPLTLKKAIGSIVEIYTVNSGNSADLAWIRRTRRSAQNPSERKGVTPSYRQPLGQETGLLDRSTKLIPKIGLEIKKYLRTAVRQEKLFLIPNVRFGEISDMLDEFISLHDDQTDVLTRHSYTNIVGWWSQFLVEVAREKYGYTLDAEDPGNNLTAAQIVEVAKEARERLLSMIIKRFFRKTKQR